MLKSEFLGFEANFEELSRTWKGKGKFFVFHGREHRGPFDTLQHAADAAVEWHPDTTSFLIRRVGVDELQELVDQVTPENRHDESDWGPPVGKEVW